MWIRLLLVFVGLCLWDSIGILARGAVGDETSSSALRLNELLLESSEMRGERESGLNNETVIGSENTKGSEERRQGKDKISLFSHLEMRNTESRLLRQEPSREAELDHLSLALEGNSGSSINYFMEASLEQAGGESRFLLGQVFIELSREEGGLSGKVGQLMMPVGWLNERQDLFFSKPIYYQYLYPGSKPLDLGVTLEWKPLGVLYPYLASSCYSGQAVARVYEWEIEPKRRPCEISIRQRIQGVELFLTRFTHDLALHDALEANGLGFEVQSPEYLQSYKLRMGLLSEAWRMTQSQDRGPENTINAWMVFPYLKLDKVKIGYRLARTEQELNLSKDHRLRSTRSENLVQIEAIFTKSLKLIYESEQAFSSIPEADRWALRLLFDLDWPSLSGS